ncbi:ATP-binding cassette domain-containing protein [Methanolacinia paynteri]|uniref:ATP-binding cassette domain-containing protein n=1 Tax=Methanolacinia paynteri TaxID=230356 RepID=UPI00064E6CF3|nr:ATP-binding cassette domain-containing protein [Methanolacinia paynteri]
MGVIEIRGLTKKFDELVAVDDVSLSVERGELFGLLGPNGAGKTTIINMLTTLLKPTSGTAEIAGYDIGKDPASVRRNIGIVFQDTSLDLGLTGMENLEFHAMMYDIKSEERRKRIDELLAVVGLTDKAGTLVEYYSGGMKRRLEIARGLIHRPEVLFLDEPTLGLDAQTRRKIWDYIKRLNDDFSTTIILTTHYMEEADYLCDRIAVIDNGNIIALDTPVNLKNRLEGEKVLLDVDMQAAGTIVSVLKDKSWVRGLECEDGSISLTIIDGSVNIPEIFRLAYSAGVGINSVSLHKPSLEDVFIQLTGSSIREESGDRKSAMRERRRRRMMR